MLATACVEEDSPILQGGNCFPLHYFFLNRESNVIALTNTRENNDDTSGFMIMNDEPVKIEDYGLHCQISGSEYAMYANPLFKDGEWYRKSYRVEGDAEMEGQITTWYLSNGDSTDFFDDTDYDEESLMYHYLMPVEYRTDECISIAITSDTPFFGKEAGCDLRQFFNIYSYCFLFTHEKKLLRRVGTMPIKEYLAYRPMVLPWYIFRFSEMPDSVPSEADFYVEITLANGKHLTGSTHVSFVQSH